MNKLFELISGRVGSLSITAGIVIALMSFPSTAQEAEESQAANDEPMEEILVTGVRRSLELALVNNTFFD